MRHVGRELTLRLITLVALVVAACSPVQGLDNPPEQTLTPATLAPSLGQPSAAATPPTVPSAAATPAYVDSGGPTDPLPRPLSAPGGSEQAAGTLAKQVLAGGQDALPALLAAFQAAGIAIRNPDDTLALRPAEPWQGLIYETWELRPLLNLVHPQHTVYLGLTDLADAIRTAAPELESLRLEQLLLDDIRSRAQGEPSPRQFLARFIAELGRQAQGSAQNDLLRQADPATVHLDGLQASLVLRQLSLDLLILGGTEGSGPGLKSLPGPEPARADSEVPCTLNSTQRTILDVFAFGMKVGVGGLTVGESGWEGLARKIDTSLDPNRVAEKGPITRARNLAGIVLAYAKFIVTYALLDVEVTMNNAPLVRTKAMRPRSGEQRDLTATVRMKTGNAQLITCFGIMLNMAGLDFKLPNDGPVKNARVAWEGLDGFNEAAAVFGGPVQIVRFVSDPSSQIQQGGDVSSGQNAVNNQVTDVHGEAHISVEGVGQRKQLSDNATQIRKQAKLRVQVALKGADMFKDFLDASNTALSKERGLLTVPLEMLYRAKWYSGGFYTVDVIDWTDGAWHGTVEYSWTLSGEDGPNKTSWDELVIATIRIDDNGQGTWEATATAHYDSADPKCRENVLSTATGGGEASLSVVTIADAVSGTSPYVPYVPASTDDPGQVLVVVGPSGDYDGATVFTAKGNRKSNGAQGTICKGPAYTEGYEARSGPTWEGKLDPNNPNVLEGRVTKPIFTFGDRPASGTETVSWKLTNK